MRSLPLLILALGCRSENGIVSDKGGNSDDTPVDSGDTDDDCADTEVPYNGLDDDCDPLTPDDDLDDDGFPSDEDCDDTDPAVNPDATEECNGVDDDCDGVIDPTVDWFTDGDGDGWGADGGADCEPPEDSVTQGGDCDDDNDAVNPGATEVCNGIDDDCDTVVDGVTDGYGASEACPAVDCKDLLAVLPSTVDGVWWIGDDADATTDPFEARCDMTTDGGGWTHILSMNPAFMTQYDGAEVLENRQTVGALGDDNHLSPGFYRVAFDNAYAIDDTAGVPVLGDGSWVGGTIGDDIDAQLAGIATASWVWRTGSRSGFLVRTSETTDHVFADGDLRVHFMVNHDDTANVGFPVTTVYTTNERHLVFDSDFGYAGGRIYTDALYDVATTGVDEVFGLYVR